jgi:hypothetical protein
MWHRLPIRSTVNTHNRLLQHKTLQFPEAENLQLYALYEVTLGGKQQFITGSINKFLVVNNSIVEFLKL